MIKKIAVILCLVAFFAWNAFPLLASTTEVDYFNSYTNGDLNGQGSWSGSAVEDVQDSVVYEGAKAVEAQANDFSGVEKSITGISSNIFGWAMQSTTVDARPGILLYEGATYLGQIYYEVSGGTLYLITQHSAGTSQEATVSTGSYHIVRAEFDAANERFRVTLDNADMSGATWRTVIGSSFTQMNKIGLSGGCSSTNICYWDYFFYDDQASETVATKKVPDIISLE